MKVRLTILLLIGIFFTFMAKKQKTNIIFIFIDDMGYADLGCYGNNEVRTTNIDQLAKEGILFTQFYVNSPICSLSRTAVTTGQYPSRWGITSFINSSVHNDRRGVNNYLSLEAPSVARDLQKAGYYTAQLVNGIWEGARCQRCPADNRVWI